MDNYLAVAEQAEFHELESIIERGMKTFVEVGNALTRIRDGRLYRASHSTFEDYCQERWSLARRTAYQYIEAASVVENVRHGAQVEPPNNERQTRPLTRLEPEQQIEVWRTAVETAPNGRVTAAHVESVVQEYQQVARPHVSNNSGNNEWYTPVEYIRAAREVMGSIDLDPATSEAANEVVGALNIYTIEDNGLARGWSGNVWLNPPYATELISGFVEKLCFHFKRGEVRQAIVLVNNATETGWFQQLAEQATAVCFPRRRVRFWRPGGGIGQPLQGQAVLYLGDNPMRFETAFREFGLLCSIQ